MPPASRAIKGSPLSSPANFEAEKGSKEAEKASKRSVSSGFRGHTCDPAKDSGWTQADQPGSGSPGFCIFFARGCCGFGHKWLGKKRARNSPSSGCQVDFKPCSINVSGFKWISLDLQLIMVFPSSFSFSFPWIIMGFPLISIHFQ